MVRKALLTDLDNIMLIYKNAKRIMVTHGNENQWLNGYPSQKLLEEDITKGNLYVIERNACIVGVFALIFGVDPTYLYIEGKWLSDASYGTIHRIGSSGEAKGILKEAVDYAYTILPHVRIDTHEDNIIMKKALPKLGFKYCGIIYLSDGAPRLAYELVDK